MTKTVEELKKIISEQELDLLIKEREEMLNLQERRKFNAIQNRLADDEDFNSMPSDEQLTQLKQEYTHPYKSQVRGDDKDKIFENFAKEFGKQFIQGDSLAFPSDEQAVDFFKRQAQEGHAFLAQRVGRDEYFFSDGKGQFIQGTKQEIDAYRQKNTPEQLDQESIDDSTHQMLMHHD